MLAFFQYMLNYFLIQSKILGSSFYHFWFIDFLGINFYLIMANFVLRFNTNVYTPRSFKRFAANAVAEKFFRMKKSK